MRPVQDLAVLTEDQVREIHKSHMSAAKLASEYHVSRQSIYNIKRGATWKHLGLRPLRTVKNKPITADKPPGPPIKNRQVKTTDPKLKERTNGSEQFNGFFGECDDFPGDCQTCGGIFPCRDCGQPA